MSKSPSINPPAFDRRLFIVLWLAGVSGAILVLPYAFTLQAPALALVPVPLPVLAVASAVQSAVLIGLLTAAGLWLAGRTGLGAPILAAWLRGERVRERLRAILAPALAVGVLGGAAFVAIQSAVIGPLLSAHLDRLGVRMPETLTPPAWQGFLASFYGGIAEELLLRLFLFSMFAWLGSRVWHTDDGRPTRGVLWTANVLAAFLFGAGHLPAASAAGLPLDAVVVSHIVLGNAAFGIAFGALYAAYGLESAMLAHFSADIVLHVLAPLLFG